MKRYEWSEVFSWTRHAGADSISFGLTLRHGGKSIAESGDQVRVEAVMLETRLSEEFVRSGHLARCGSRLACTLSGRLVADWIVHQILD